MTTQKERFEVLDRLQRAGVSYEDANKLRRIAMTLHRWSELECGTDTGAIERDEATGKPYWYRADHNGKRYPVADREKGAQKRLAKLMERYKGQFIAYEQGDPRGASLYLVRPTDVPKGGNIDGYYSNGIAVY